MRILEVELPEVLAAFVRERSGADLNSAAASAYVLSVIEEHRARHERLMDEVRKGADSGDSARSVDEVWERAVERAKSRAA
jgi:hypothetical protein